MQYIMKQATGLINKFGGEFREEGADNRSKRQWKRPRWVKELAVATVTAPLLVARRWCATCNCLTLLATTCNSFHS
jgi:hypothetical protein